MNSPLHLAAVKASIDIRRDEAVLVAALSEIERTLEYLKLQNPSMISYATRGLGHSSPYAQILIAVSRKAIEVPEIHAALAEQRTTLSKVKAVVPVINRENQAAWLEKAATLSARELEREVARATGNETKRVTLQLDLDTIEALDRARELMAQKTGKRVSASDAIKFLAEQYVSKHDPVAKADRNAQKTHHVVSKANVRHKVQARDRGACQYRLPDGKICGAKLWVDIHHIKPRAEGGKDTLENLITLCSAHHRLIHQH